MLAMMALPLMLSCSKDDEEEFGGNTNVIVNENGTTSNGSIFSAVGDNVFYLDYMSNTVLKKDIWLYLDMTKLVSKA